MSSGLGGQLLVCDSLSSLRRTQSLSVLLKEQVPFRRPEQTTVQAASSGPAVLGLTGKELYAVRLSTHVLKCVQ